ncbi:MAG: hypothetical protein EOO20_02870 [Chryseobacterium sp.]|uniref:PD-(D/E)XK nuclease family protein n=1 Tax=Pedobacter agri TaxID=454586 RepID=UPI0011FB3DFA|nr:PD-(D/E)XK nuclease family protein [Pedobacter agri]RZJ92129.1 MAG: hypothetical protein EOO20_02870 [Chryseobacterium sp.]
MATILLKNATITSNPVIPDWSYSRMQVLHSCPRKYYYTYYGGKKFVALNEQNKDVIQFLKTLSNGYLLVGEIVHHLIKSYFKRKSKGDSWDLTRLQSFGYRILKDAIVYSMELRDEIFNEYKFTPRSLMEVYYNEVDPSVFRNKLRAEINHHLEMFFKSENFLHLREGCASEDAEIEKRTHFSLGNVRIDGAADLLFKYGEDLLIADWKTGEMEIEDTSLQLLTYAWWALETNRASKNNILLQKAYLLDGHLEKMEFSGLHLQRAKAKIIQDSERLIEFDEFGKEGVMDAFTVCGQERICHQCSFKKICLGK